MAAGSPPKRARCVEVDAISWERGAARTCGPVAVRRRRSSRTPRTPVDVSATRAARSTREELPLVVGPARGHELVDRSEVRAGDLPDRGVHRVADDDRARDDRRAEQRAEHDERRLARPADGVAEREPAQHRPADEDREERQRERAPTRMSATAVIARSPARAPPLRRARAARRRRARRPCTVISRSARAATVGSCVTRTSVSPSSCSSAEQVHDRRRRLRVEVAGRLVGPDEPRAGRRARARSRRAAARRRRARAADGRAGARGRRASSVSRARLRASASCTPASSSGSSTFSVAVKTGIRLNAWKMKPIVSARWRVRFASESSWIEWPSTRTRPPSISSRPGEAVEQRRLARSRRPHDREELAGGNGQVEPLERADVGAPGAVDLADGLGDQDRLGHLRHLLRIGSCRSSRGARRLASVEGRAPDQGRSGVCPDSARPSGARPCAPEGREPVRSRGRPQRERLRWHGRPARGASTPAGRRARRCRAASRRRRRDRASR